MMHRLDTGFARWAWKAAEGAQQGGFLGEFRSRVNSLPAMLQGAGLAAALAFLQSKGDNQACKLLAHEVATRIHEAVPALDAEPNNLLSQLGKEPFGSYAYAAAIARQYAGWLHRAVEALTGDAGGGG